MRSPSPMVIDIESRSLLSVFLGREIKVDFYLPAPVEQPSSMSLLLINDGQNMPEVGLRGILQRLYAENSINPVLCAAVHTGIQRKMDYGVASRPDYLGRGANAANYTSFISRELLPFIRDAFAIPAFRERAFAGFSLGALSALDIVMRHPEKFSKAGLFSGSFWWRSVDQTAPGYEDDLHRIMHQEVRNWMPRPGMKFFFQCGNLDETMDRNNNGVIDSIDDTLDLIEELVKKGYDRHNDIRYLELPEGRHDMATWASALPEFLKWAFPVIKSV